MDFTSTNDRVIFNESRVEVIIEDTDSEEPFNVLYMCVDECVIVLRMCMYISINDPHPHTLTNSTDLHDHRSLCSDDGERDGSKLRPLLHLHHRKTGHRSHHLFHHRGRHSCWSVNGSLSVCVYIILRSIIMYGNYSYMCAHITCMYPHTHTL